MCTRISYVHVALSIHLKNNLFSIFLFGHLAIHKILTFGKKRYFKYDFEKIAHSKHNGRHTLGTN